MPGHDKGCDVPLSPPVASLLKHFQAQKPARVWSLIVTLYGDAIVPRGGSLWIGSLIEIMDLFGVDAGHVRTAISRLSSDGWLARIKRGRASYYRLSKRGEGTFVAATRRIYFGETHEFDGRVRIALLGPDLIDPAATRRALAQSEFAAFTPTVLLGLDDPPPQLAARKGLILIRVTPDEALRETAAAAWKLRPIAEAYRAFIVRFAPLQAALARRPLGEADALVARTLLIHAYRRIVLRDPGLPAALLPPDWPGEEARNLAAALYRALREPSESYVTAHARDEKGPLPPPGADFARRFSSPGQ